MGTRGLFALVALAASGCAYPEFAFAPPGSDAGTDVLDGSTDDTALADTAVDDTLAEDSSSVDSASDTAPVDTGADTKADTTVDTGAVDTGADTGPKVGCAGVMAAFCRDFDGASATIATSFDDTYLRGGGALAFDTTYTRSSPRSLLASVPAGTVETAANAHSSFIASSESRAMVLDFWVRLDNVPSGSGPLLAKLTRGTSNRGIALYVGAGAMAVDVMATTTSNYKMTRTLPANTWLHVRFEGALLTTTGGWFKLFVDDMKTPALSQSGLATTTVTGTEVKMNIGLYDSGTSPAVKAWIDDVIFDWL